MEPVKHIRFKWDTVHDGVESLAHMLESWPRKPRVIVAVARGGLVPATLLSHRLDVRLATIQAAAYEGTRRTPQKPIRITGWKPDFNSSDVVIVDDILDSGDTLSAIIQEAGNVAITNFHFYSLVNKSCKRFPEHKNFFAQVPSTTWVHFPWEVSSANTEA